MINSSQYEAANIATDSAEKGEKMNLVTQAFKAGAAAFRTGTERVPILDKQFLVLMKTLADLNKVLLDTTNDSALAKAWLNGWDAANIQAEVL